MQLSDKSNPSLDASVARISTTVVIKDEFRTMSPTDESKPVSDMDRVFFGPYPVPDWSLVVSKQELEKSGCRNWPPRNWDSHKAPRDDSWEATKQWFDYYTSPRGVLCYRESLDRENGRLVDCSRCVRDAWRLVRHFNALGKTKIDVKERPGRYDAHEALIDLENIRNQLFPPSATPSNVPTDAKPRLNSLTFVPGAFIYRGHRVELSGKPLQVLEALAEANEGCLTLSSLKERFWDKHAGEDTIRSAVSDARTAVRRAIRDAAVSYDPVFDPIKCVDRSPGRTAWRLDLP